MSRRRWARTAKSGGQELPLPPRHTAGLWASWLTHPEGCRWHGQIRQGGPGGHHPQGTGLGCNPLRVNFDLISFILPRIHSPTGPWDVTAGPHPSGRGLAQTPAPGAPSTRLPFWSQAPAEARPPRPLPSPDRPYRLYFYNYIHFHPQKLPDQAAWCWWRFGDGRRCWHARSSTGASAELSQSLAPAPRRD